MVRLGLAALVVIILLSGREGWLRRQVRRHTRLEAEEADTTGTLNWIRSVKTFDDGTPLWFSMIANDRNAEWSLPDGWVRLDGRCNGTTTKGQRCKRLTAGPYCAMHGGVS